MLILLLVIISSFRLSHLYLKCPYFMFVDQHPATKHQRGWLLFGLAVFMSERVLHSFLLLGKLFCSRWPHSAVFHLRKLL